MPPKKTGRGKKKGVSIPIVKQTNGEGTEDLMPIGKRGKVMDQQVETANPVNGDTPPLNGLENGHKDNVEPPPAKKRGRQRNAVQKSVEASEENHEDVVDESAKGEEVEELQSEEDALCQAEGDQKPSEENIDSNKKSEQELGTNETVSKKGKVQSRRQESKSVDMPEQTKQEGQGDSEDKLEQELDTKETALKKGKVQSRRQGKKLVDVPEQTTLEVPQVAKDSDEKMEPELDTKETASEKGKVQSRKQGTRSDIVPEQTKLEVPEVDKDSNEKMDQELVTKEPASKKGKGRSRRQDTKSVDVPELTTLEVPEVGKDSDEKMEQGLVTKEPASKKGKGRSRRQGTKSVDVPEQTTLEVHDKSKDSDKKVEPDLDTKEPASKKGKGRSRRQDAKMDAVPEVAEQLNLDAPEIGQDSDEKLVQETSSKKGKGRKQENASKNISKEESRGLKRKAGEPAPVSETRFVQVSLLRQKIVDDMAIEEMNRVGKVKAAVGSSKGNRKRVVEDAEDEAKPSKAPKASSSKLPKKKIPDVSVLDFGNTSTTKSGEAWNLKIASWNVNGIRAWLEKDGASYLRVECPDVLCVQETKCSKDKLPKEANVEGYHCYWLAGDKDGYSGVGVLTKQKPLAVEYGIGMDEHDAEGRVIMTEFDKFYLVAAYVPNAGKGLVRLEYRKQWDVDFRAFLKKLDNTKPVVLCGDLNVAHKEIDLANPKTNKKNAGFTQEERDGFSALLSTGFVDAYRALYPDKAGAYTFWTYMMNARAKNVGWRLDYFVISERLAEHLCDCCIRSEVMGSDHCPLVLFLNV